MASFWSIVDGLRALWDQGATAASQLPAALGSQTAPLSLSTTPAQLPAAAWATGATAQDLRNYSDAEFQVSGLTGGDTIAVTRSIDGTNYAACSWVNQAFATGSTISADGIYSFPGGGYLKWTKTGSAGTPTVTVRASS